jgi:hypothetical protein
MRTGWSKYATSENGVYSSAGALCRLPTVNARIVFFSPPHISATTEQFMSIRIFADQFGHEGAVAQHIIKGRIMW